MKIFERIFYGVCDSIATWKEWRLFFIDEEATWGIYFNVAHDFLVQTSIQVDLLALNAQQIATIRTLSFLNEELSIFVYFFTFVTSDG